MREKLYNESCPDWYFVKQKSEDVVVIVSGSLKPYFYFIFWTSAAVNRLQQCVKAFRIVLDGEDLCRNFAFRAEDEAAALILGNVNSHTNYDEYLRYVYLMLVPQDTLRL